MQNQNASQKTGGLWEWLTRIAVRVVVKLAVAALITTLDPISGATMAVAAFA